MNPYIDINGVDRTNEIEELFLPTVEDIHSDPQFYAELVNDLMFHWVYGTRETQMMVIAKKNLVNKRTDELDEEMNADLEAQDYDTFGEKKI